MGMVSSVYIRGRVTGYALRVSIIRSSTALPATRNPEHLKPQKVFNDQETTNSK